MDLAGFESAPVTLMGFRAAVTPQAHWIEGYLSRNTNAWSYVTPIRLFSRFGKTLAYNRSFHFARLERLKGLRN